MALTDLQFIGQTETFTCPSSRKITIRENTGEDEGFLSSIKDSAKGFGVNRYLSSIIVADHSNGDSPVSIEQVAAWPVKDKYYTLFRGRVLSLGAELNFKHTCQNEECNKVKDFTENLLDFDTPLDEYFALKEADRKEWLAAILSKKPFAITPYPLGSKLSIEEQLSSGYKVKLDILTGLMEQTALEEDAINKNSGLITRNFQVWDDVAKEWQTETLFRRFSSKQMIPIRALVPKYDAGWEPISKTVCPFCKDVDYTPLLRNPDFFYPEET